MSNDPRPGLNAKGEPLSIRQQLRQRRELDDLRKFGLAPLARDAVSGQEISSIIPTNLTQAPFYYGVEGPTLEHQRAKGADSRHGKEFDDAVDRVEAVGRQSHFVAGACENCGSTTHKSRDCILPKRKAGSSISGVVEGEDQRVVVSGGSKSYRQKRDQWAGAVNCDDLWTEHSKKRPRGDGDGDDKAHAVAIGGGGTVETFAAQAGNVGSSEIKALPRYLENLEAGTFYDPITRSMRGNPHELAGSIDTTFRGENDRMSNEAVRDALELQRRFLSGESACLVDLEWDEKTRAAATADKGDSAPRFPSQSTGSSDARGRRKDDLVTALYGAGTLTEETFDHSKALLDPSLTAAPVSAVPLATQPPPMAGMVNGQHSSIYGSYFDVSQLRWGYACCKCLNAAADCTRSKC